MDAYRKAQDLLSRRAHFTVELRRKLEQRGYDAESIAKALDRLTDLGYLDDSACARRLAGELFHRRGYGRRVVSGRLRRKGVDPALAAAVVDEVFAALDPGELDAVLLRLWNRKRQGREDFYQYLYRRGFLAGEIEGFFQRWDREPGREEGGPAHRPAGCRAANDNQQRASKGEGDDR